MQDLNIENEITENTPNNESGVLSKSIEGGKWMFAGYAIQKIVGLASTLILARLLAPSDFGIMAIVLLVPGFLLLITEAGFGAAVIQKTGEIRHYLNPIWTFGILKALFITLTLFIIGPFIARFFHVESAQIPIQLGGFLILLSQLYNPGETCLFKEMDFKKIFIRNTARDTAYVIVSLLVIIWSRSYWALIAGTFASYAVQVISTYILHPYRPSISFKFGVLRDLFGYGKWIAAKGWIGQILGLMENVAIGKVAGIADIGLYSKAKNLASVAPGFLNSIIMPVSFSAYAKIKNTQEKIREGFVKSLHLIFFFLIPIILTILIGGGKIILILLGNQWLPMADTLRIFLIFYLFNAIIEIIYTLLKGIGHPKAITQLALINIAITSVCLFYLTTHFKIAGTAFALLIGIVPIFFLSMRYLKKLTTIKYSDIFNTLITPLIASIIIFSPIVLLKEKILQLETFQMFIMAVVVGLLYIGLICLIGKKTKYGPYDTIKLVFKHII